MGSTKTEKESNILSGSVISVVWLFVLFVLNSAQSSGKKKKMWQPRIVWMKSCQFFFFIIQGKGSSWKGFDPEIYFVAIAYGNLTRLSFLSWRT